MSPLVNLPGPETYSVDIVGESHYQRELEQICGGRTEEGHKLIVEVYLVPENDNPHDDQAVRVYVRDKTVGYLSRELARSYRKRLAEAGYPGSPATCAAMIVGGWDRGGSDRGHFGVKLDLPTG
ncbi:MAG: HIRAN domain-containing protein [Leptospirillia bacterium]